MSMGFAVQLIRTGVAQVLIVGAPMLIIGITVGLIISILQATTSIQEQTLTFVPKIAAILFALFLFAPWMLSVLIAFTEGVFGQIPGVSG